MVDHLEVPHLDPLDAAGTTEVVDACVLGARERVRVLRALRRVEGALDASLLGGRDHAEVACGLRHGVRAMHLGRQRPIELRPAALRPCVEELPSQRRERQVAGEEMVEGERVEALLRCNLACGRFPLGANRLEGVHPRCDELNAVEPEDLDRRLTLFGGRGDMPVVGVDQMLLGIVDAGVEQERTLVPKRDAGRPRRRARLAHRETCTFEALALRAARVEVLPGVGEPPVVLGAQRAVEGERFGRRPEAIDEHRLLAERDLAVGALARAGRRERGSHVRFGEWALVEHEDRLGAFRRGPLEEGARPFGCSMCRSRGEARWRLRLGVRADHAGVSPGRT